MRLTEKILAALIIIGLTLKLLFIPGGTVLYTISLIVLANIYFILGFAFFNQIRLRNIFKRDSYKDKTPIKIIYAVLLGLFLSSVIIGIIFKLNHWPGAKLNLIIGLVPILILLILGFVLFLKSKDNVYLIGLKRVIIIGGIGLFMYLSSDMVVEKIQYRKHPAYIKAYEQYLNDPQDEKLKAKLKMEYDRARYDAEYFEMMYPNDSTDIDKY